jgi:acetylornithine deacetylase/succinyl-diaminopimelate desuccinylase-like protein
MGGHTLYLDGKKIYPIMCAEKGTCWIKIRAHGQPGHGSVPHADHAVMHLVHAIDRLMAHSLPLHMTATASTYVQRLARSVGGTNGMLLSAILNPILHEAALKALPDRSLADSLHAIFHNTVSPNLLRAGYKTNVIPSEAEAVIDGRMLPGCDVEAFLAEIRPRLGEGIEITIEHTSHPLEVSSETPLFKLIEQQLARSDPGAIAVPYMLTGATDAKLFAQLGTQCYGFAPLKLQPDTPFDGLVHGHDERINIDAFGFGVQVLYETVCEFCGAA